MKRETRRLLTGCSNSMNLLAFSYAMMEERGKAPSEESKQDICSRLVEARQAISQLADLYLDEGAADEELRAGLLALQPLAKDLQQAAGKKVNRFWEEDNFKLEPWVHLNHIIDLLSEVEQAGTMERPQVPNPDQAPRWERTIRVWFYSNGFADEKADKAVAVFHKAIGAGLMEEKEEWLKWHRSKNLLAYLLARLTGGEKDKKSKYPQLAGGQAPAELARLFGNEDLKTAIKYVRNHYAPKGFEEIEELLL